MARPAKRDVLSEAAADYLKRANGLARPLGFKGPDDHFISPSKSGDPADEADRLRGAVSGAAVLLDERGEMMSSPQIASFMASQRDSGVRSLSFCIGGADGFDPGFRNEVVQAGGALLAFGRAVWPHALCRVMLAEQIYRALAILARHPYHRGG